MKYLKYFTVAIFTMALVPFTAQAAYISEIGTTISPEVTGIYLDGIYMGHEGKGAFAGENGNIMIPARYIDLYINGTYGESKIQWDDSIKEFSAINGDGEKTITAVQGEYFVTVDSEKIEQTAANVIVDGRLYIPLESAVKYAEAGDRKISYIENSAITNLSNSREVYQASSTGKMTDKQIENFITENIDSRFKPEKFSKEILKTETNSDASVFIIYKYKIGDIETNSGYFVAVYGNGAEISLIGDELYDLDENSIVDEDITEDELKERAIKSDNLDCKVTGQTIEKHFVPTICRNVYDVETTYINGDIVYETLNRFVIK